MVDVVPAPGGRVWGAAYDAPEAALAALDRKEGAGFAYRRREVEVELAGELRPAVTYEVIDKDPQAPPATPEYASLVLRGARERGLPEEWLATLDSVLRGSVPAPMTEERTTLRATASYEAEPGEVGRVLLLYSGGLDTSVMLKWIQDEYEAEVVALTVNLGQPGEEFDVVRGKALQLGRARLPRGRRARGVRRATTCCPPSRPTRSTAAAIRCSPRSAAR